MTMINPIGVAAVPATVTRLQAKIALKNAGMLAQVEAVIAQADDVTKMTWADALHFYRNSNLLLSLAAALGLTEAQIDQLFIDAERIEP